MFIILRHGPQHRKIVAHPADDILDPLFKAVLLTPAQFGTKFAAVQRIGKILAKPLFSDRNMFFRIDAHHIRDKKYQISDTDDPGGRNVKNASRPTPCHNFMRCPRYILNMNKTSSGTASAMQLQYAASKKAKNSTRHNTVQLLARTEDIGRACKNYWEIIGPVKTHQAHIHGSL